MNPKLLHRVVALLLFLFALTHGLGMLSDSGHGFVMDLVVFGMESAPVERLGVQRTIMDFHVGYGALFVVPAVYTLVAKARKRVEEREPEALANPNGHAAVLAAPLAQAGTEVSSI